jgi:hypothetical protein
VPSRDPGESVKDGAIAVDEFGLPRIPAQWLFFVVWNINFSLFCVYIYSCVWFSQIHQSFPYSFYRNTIER